MKHILVPCDGSANALRALAYAAGLAKDNPGVRLELLHVLDPMRFRNPAAALPPDELERRRAAALAHVLQPARAVLDAAGVQYQVHARTGDPAGEIAAQVAESGCDGVVMGTRGLGPVASLMIGSVACHVVHLVQVPVTLVH
ncbi:universal stress protein [Massilia sp. GCM10020059]|uniref:Universal stress protein n=1 Tax=Massilia agrisoli TaxID=2892444 RepID=A0ABS8IPY2_9BURK|nr:universal stress protein [Massilia agrisoli]